MKSKVYFSGESTPEKVVEIYCSEKNCPVRLRSRFIREKRVIRTLEAVNMSWWR